MCADRSAHLSVIIFWGKQSDDEKTKNNLDKTGFLLDLFRNLWYNVKCRIINSKNEY